MAIAGKGVKGKEALHVVFLNFEQDLSFRGLSFRDTWVPLYKVLSETQGSKLTFSFRSQQATNRKIFATSS